MPRLGVHLSIAGGMHNAIAAAGKLRCDSLQVFLRNQRQWHSRPLSDEQVLAWQAARRRRPVQPVLAHASYLVNPASPADPLWEASCRELLDELDRCDRLGIEFLVVHPGSHLGKGIEAGVERVVQALDRLAEQRPASATIILLETTAGQGGSVGHRFEHLARIIAAINRPQAVGVCLDTCHVFTAGYDLRTAAAVEATLDEFDAVIGLAALRAVHVNDSKRSLGSRVDRHEHIGLGQIGVAGFRALLADPRLADLPVILETPKGIDPKTGRDWDAINLSRLRALQSR